MIGYLVALGTAIVTLFIEMAKFLLLGLTVAGLLSVFVRKSFVARHIGGHGFAAILKASLLGVPLPLCSCGVVPTAAYLRRSGASNPAVMAFLISTPQTGMDSIAATFGMLGPFFAVFRPLTALLTGLLGGGASSIALRMERGQSRNPSIRTVSSAAATDRQQQGTRSGDCGQRSLAARVKDFVRYAYGEAVDDIAVQFIIGLVIAGLIALFIPDDFFADTVFSRGLPSMLLMVAVGIPMYVCSTSSIPIAVALIAKGISPGAAYVFLVAGPATNAATLAILTRILGKKQTVIYVTSIIVGSLGFGPLMDAITTRFGWIPGTTAMHAEHTIFGVFDYLSAAILLLLLVTSLYRRFRALRTVKEKAAREQDPPGNRETILDAGIRILPIEGMTCHHCAANVTDALKAVEGIESVEVDLNEKAARISGTAAYETLATAVRSAGYEVAETGNRKAQKG